MTFAQKALVIMTQFARFSCGAHCLVCFVANALQGTLPLNSEVDLVRESLSSHKV